MRGVLGALLIAVLAGCAAPSPRVVEVLPGTYRVSKDDSLFILKGEALKTGLIKDAQAFCGAKGKTVAVLDTTSRDSEDNDRASATIQFTCI